MCKQCNHCRLQYHFARQCQKPREPNPNYKKRVNSVEKVTHNGNSLNLREETYDKIMVTLTAAQILW